MLGHGTKFDRRRSERLPRCPEASRMLRASLGINRNTRVFQITIGGENWSRSDPEIGIIDVGKVADIVVTREMF
jgi:hypothetical protein